MSQVNNNIVFSNIVYAHRRLNTNNHRWNLELDKKFINKMFGVKMHLGHQTKDWHPNMELYIRAKRDNGHLINLVDTLFCLQQAARLLTLSASQGKRVLFVGTKRQATNWIQKAATSCDSFFVNQKWLGGTLTNWKKIKRSLSKLNHLEVLEQTGDLEKLEKKQIAAYKREKDRLTKHVGGLKMMSTLPDIIIIVGQPEELNALHECRKLGIKTITVVDTDCDPLLADVIIPSNDDSTKSLAFILTRLVTSIKRGHQKALSRSKKESREK